LKGFHGRYATRNRALFLFGVATGFRISEILSLTVGEVSRDKKVFKVVEVKHQHMKGKRRSRAIELHSEVRTVLSCWLDELECLVGLLTPELPLFCSRTRAPVGTWEAVTRTQAWRIWTEAYAANDLEGRLGFHATRKSFAAVMYEWLHDRLEKVQKFIGHASVSSTMAHLKSFQREELTAAVLSGTWAA